MAINTEEKRFSMVNVGVAWAAGLLPVADDNDFDTDDQRQFVLGAYSGIGWGSGGIGPQIPAYRAGGFAFDSDGRLLTMFLSEGEAVPAGAQFHGGVAYDMESGARFVCPWPASSVVFRPAGFGGGAALRADGAMTVTEADPEISDGIYGYTQRGEMCITNNVPTNFIGGFGFVGQKLAITELN